MRKKFSLILQRDSMQCGASCLAMICSYFEKNECIEYLSEQCFATTEGVSATLLGKEVCERLHISPRPCRTTATKGLSPIRIRSLQGRHSIRRLTYKNCWKGTIPTDTD